MKKNILFVLALTTFGANAQQKLVGLTTQEFDETATLTYADSISYTYNTWEGSLFSNGPEFKFDSPVFDFLYELPSIKSDEENVYSGIPLQFDYTRQNTIVNGDLTASEIATADRVEYTYDASGNVTNIEYFFWNVSQFDIYAESTFEYDGNNNLLVESYISDPVSSPLTESVDSMFYNGSNQLIRHIGYDWDGSAMVPESESTMTYSGNEVDNLIMFQNTGTQFEWVYDIYYTYSGGMPDMIEAYAVTGGVPATTTEIEIFYTYNVDNQLSLYEVFFAGDLFVQQAYTYDAQGFVEKIESSDLDFATSSLYVSEVMDFYYQSTASINELPIVEMSVYPNPSSDLITIESDKQINRISVVATDGKVMIEQKGNTIDVSNLSAGVYLVNVTTSGGAGQTRFVKN